MALRVLKELWWFRSTVIMVATPLLLTLILPFYDQMGLTKPACNCLYMLLLMAVYWCTETIPLAVTSLIPLVLSPLLSIQKADDVSREYLKELNVMFMGGLMVAVVIEHSQLHRRISLGILKKVGTNPRFLMLGFMIPTWFLSMWISNTATTAMMLSIVQAVIEQLKVEDIELNEVETSANEGAVNKAYTPTMDKETEANSVQTVPPSNDQPERNSQALSKWQSTSKALSLCVCYAATCGGIATLTGTGPNLIFSDNMKRLSKQLNHDFGVNFVSWFGFGLPVSCLMLIITWLWLQIYFIGFRGSTQTSEERASITKVINREYAKLGPMAFKEKLATAHFVLLAALWISMDPGEAGGWGRLFPKDYVSEGTAAMFVVILAFLWPSEMPDVYWLRGGCGRPHGYKAKHREPLITWEVMVKKVPWGLILLLGGGFALAESLRASGLSDILGTSLNFFNGWPTWGIVLCLSVITAAITEVTSNSAISNIFLPIIGSVAVDLKIHPLYLMLPVTASTSFAFMLPVATPPNALVFATGVLSVKDMAKAGALLNLMGICVVTLATFTWGAALFKFDDFHYSHLNVTMETNTTMNATVY